MNVPTMIGILDDHGFEEIGTTRKTEALQDAIWEIETLRPWPFLETSVDLNFDGTSDVPTNFPANFRAAMRMKDLVTARRILPIRMEDLEDRIGTDYGRVDDPLFYWFEGNALKCWPIPPSSTGRAKLRYLKVSAAITENSVEADIILPPRHHMAIVFGALARLAAQEDDVEMAQYWEGKRDVRVTVMVDDVFHKQYDQPDFIRVIDADEWDYDLL